MAKASPAPLSASLLGVPKGAATPAIEPEGQDTTGTVLQSQPEMVRRSAPEIVLPPLEEPKTALTVRLPLRTQERLREAAHRTRKEKQAIVDEALSAWLDRLGY